MRCDGPREDRRTHTEDAKSMDGHSRFECYRLQLHILKSLLRTPELAAGRRQLVLIKEIILCTAAASGQRFW